MGFDFTVEYKPGSTNVVADTLSRREAAAAEAMALSSPTFHLWEELRWQLGGMPDYQHLRQEVEAGRKGSQWAIKDGLVLKTRRVFVPEQRRSFLSSCLRPMMLHMRGPNAPSIAFGQTSTS